MKTRMTLLLAAATFLAITPLLAEKVDMNGETLKETATHIVTGKVLAIYGREVKSEKWLTSHWVAEVAIDAVEKGEGLEKGGLVYVRYWTRSWIGAGAPPPGTNGHRGIPTEGQTLRIYAAKNAYDGFSNENTDGGYNVIGANGFEAIK